MSTRLTEQGSCTQLEPMPPAVDERSRRQATRSERLYPRRVLPGSSRVPSPWQRRRHYDVTTGNEPTYVHIARQVALHVFESLHGTGNSKVLDRVLAAGPKRMLAQQQRIIAAVGAVDRPVITVSSAHTCAVTPHAVEAALSVRVDARHRAIAIRLEHAAEGWQVTALEIG
ncbi:hypothetical protein SAMN06309944_2256 [Micrococcales bacterium KH10]|nr:hypothetical protein SAMN06309944_2256 [Micrococcales bacterium KH10]